MNFFDPARPDAPDRPRRDWLPGLVVAGIIVAVLAVLLGRLHQRWENEAAQGQAEVQR